MSGELESYQAEISGGLMSFGEVLAVPPQYLWEPYLRLNNLNIVRGDGGAGKTMLVLAILAAVTRGKAPDNMPGLLHCGPSNALYMGAEDDLEDYRHRLDLCGCDANRVFTSRTLPFLDALGQIERLIRESEAKIVVFDPIQAFLPPRTDMNKANEVRPLLEGLRGLCRRTACTAILIEHLNKASNQKAAYRGIGSVDFVNAARSVLMVGYHPQEQRVCLQIKANARYGAPVRFEIDDAGSFQWRGTCDVTEDEVLEARRTASAKPEPELSLVLHLLEQHGGAFELTASQMIAEGTGFGITSSESLGRKLESMRPLFEREGITWEKGRNRIYRFQKSLGGSPSTSTPNG